MTNAKLQFGRVDTQTGFAATNTALFNDLRPARIVREILQNSMDAAVVAQERVAHVRFRVTEIESKDVPDIAGYKKAFQEAVKCRKGSPNGLSTPDKQVVNKITNALERLADGNHYLLSIMDNGVGLDETRMTAMLGDGTSTKSGDEGGSYGVGHFTAVPTSDLRYLLYGGVQSNGRKIAAGCAFLASRPGQDGLQGANGYLIKRFDTGRPRKVYDFIDASSIPSSLAVDLARTKQEWGHGTVIHIPAFNYFGAEGRWLSDIVQKVAAYNFGVAICQGTLVVEVDEDAVAEDKLGILRLDENTIENVLKEDADQQRSARGDGFFAGLRPSGQNAHSIYLVLIQGEHHVVDTEFGRASVWLSVSPPMGSTRVDLFRNGMWITDNIPNLNRSDFANRHPFHAVVMPEQGGELHRLIREAEGPMHNELSLKRLSDRAAKDKLRGATRAIAQWLQNRVPELGAEEYTPDDFLVVETGGEADGGGTRSFSMYGTPVIVQRASVRERIFQPGPEPVEHEGEGRGEGKGDRSRRPSGGRKSASRPLPFQSTVVPAGRGRHILSLRCAEAFDEISLSLRLHENMDATCDRIWPDETVRIRRFAIDAGEGAPNAIRSHDGTQVQLQGLVAGKTYRMTIEHEGPESVGNLDGSSALQVVLRRPQPQADGGPSDG